MYTYPFIYLVEIMMNKDPEVISSVLDFFSKKLVDKKTKEVLQIERMEGEEKKMFYLVKCEEFDDKSLLEYIDSQNVRLSRQREELIDLSVKIANLNHEDNRVKAMEEVINHYKSGLPSGIGLRDMITQIKEHYPWSSSKMYIKIFLSLVACLMGIAQYIFDVKTDIEFSLELFNKTVETKTVESSGDLRVKFWQSPHPSPACRSVTTECWEEVNTAWKAEKNITTATVMDIEDTAIAGWFSVWHIIQPFVGVFLVFLSINYKKILKVWKERGATKLV